jgi:hypothetical protein
MYRALSSLVSCMLSAKVMVIGEKPASVLLMGSL